MGLWLMPEPDAYLTGMVTVPKHNDLVPLIEILNVLENSRVTNGMSDLGSPAMGLPAGDDSKPPDAAFSALIQKAIDGDPSGLDARAASDGKPMWSCTLKFYGPAKVLPLQWEYCREKFARIPGAKFHDGELLKMPLTAEQKLKVHKPEFGLPSLSIFSIGARNANNPNPTNGHQWFSPIIPRSGEAVFEANRIFTKAGREHGLPVPPYSIPFTFWERSFLFLFGFPVTHDVETNRRSRAGFKKLVEVAAEHGFGEYRTAPAYQDLIMGTYSFNNNALLRFHETLKDAVDPNGILSPGRYGICRRTFGRAEHEHTLDHRARRRCRRDVGRFLCHRSRWSAGIRKVVRSVPRARPRPTRAQPRSPRSTRARSRARWSSAPT